MAGNTDVVELTAVQLRGRYDDWQEGIWMRSWVEPPKPVMRPEFSLPSGDPRIERTVMHEVRCSSCEWAYCEGETFAGTRLKVPENGVSISYSGGDLRGILHWSSLHQVRGYHVQAWALVKKSTAVIESVELP